MKNSSINLLCTLLIFSLLIACVESDNQEKTSENKSGNNEPADSSFVVDITALDYTFTMPEETPSGWVNLRINNKGEEVHNAFIAPAPDSMDFEQARSKVKEAIELGQKREWHFSKLSPGPFVEVGAVSPGRTMGTLINLKPGAYFILCDIRTAENTKHDHKGMLTAFRATDQSTRIEKPDIDTKITLSDFAISTDGPIRAGYQTFEVVDTLTPIHWGLQLVHLNENQSLENIAKWINIQGLDKEYNPAPYDFLGGIRALNGRGIFQANLKPGRYAFVRPGFPVSVDEEFVIPEDGFAPAITNKPINPPATMEVPGEDSFLTLHPGRTLVTIKNKGAEQQVYLLFRKNPRFTETQFLNVVQKEGSTLQKEQNDSLAISAPFILPDPGSQKKFNIDLREGTYYLIPYIREHSFLGKRALTTSEMDLIKKIKVE